MQFFFLNKNFKQIIPKKLAWSEGPTVGGNLSCLPNKTNLTRINDIAISTTVTKITKINTIVQEPSGYYQNYSNFDGLFLCVTFSTGHIIATIQPLILNKKASIHICSKPLVLFKYFFIKTFPNLVPPLSEIGRGVVSAPDNSVTTPPQRGYLGQVLSAT